MNIHISKKIYINNFKFIPESIYIYLYIYIFLYLKNYMYIYLLHTFSAKAQNSENYSCTNYQTFKPNLLHKHTLTLKNILSEKVCNRYIYTYSF